MDDDLRATLEVFAGHDRVLVAADFDGTLAPLVDDPLTARALPGAMESMGQLSRLPGVSVALVSGRSLAVLRRLTGAAEPIVLVGSHGAESSRAGELSLDAEDGEQLTRLEAALQELLADHPGTRLEHKPTSVVLHTRGLPAARAQAALDTAHTVLEDYDLHLTDGKDVLEMAVTEAGKGPALLALAAEEGAEAILYLGDDVTDERAFEQLPPPHVTVRVGPGLTAARHRVADEATVIEVLQHVITARTTPRS